MAKICLLFCLIVGEIFLIQAITTSIATTTELPLSVAPESSEKGTREGSEVAEAPEIRRLGKHHGDKSMAGGGVIIGGLVTAVFAAVFCYIRVTRKRDGVDSVH
uniref:Transmembrane protein n=1 Tax=Cucumis sativus TaxID=3659 RepID=A0A0A0K3N0_CUCSA